MNRLSTILPAEQVLVSVDATSKKRAFEEAGLLFESLHGLNRALITELAQQHRSEITGAHSTFIGQHDLAEWFSQMGLVAGNRHEPG